MPSELAQPPSLLNRNSALARAIQETVESHVKELSQEIKYPSGDFVDPVDSYWQSAFDTLKEAPGFDYDSFNLAWDRAIKAAGL